MARRRDSFSWTDVTPEVRASIGDSLHDGGEFILQKAGEHCPHDTGTLERSGLVSVNDDICYISYDTPYAVKCHEHPSMRFRGKGRGKWLESAVRNNNDRVVQYMSDAISRVLGG
jgi:hypothetical protein